MQADQFTSREYSYNACGGEGNYQIVEEIKDFDQIRAGNLCYIGETTSYLGRFRFRLHCYVA
jgi:hypothetical protein